MKSIYTLLLMDADHNIENAKGESAEDLALKVLNKSLMSIRGEATVSCSYLVLQFHSFPFPLFLDWNFTLYRSASFQSNP